MSDLLLDAPWWLPVIVSFVGIALFISGNRRTEARIRNVGLGLLGLAALLVLLVWLVDTPKKIALRETKQLIAAVQAGDWKTFRSLLAKDAGLRVLTTRSFYQDADQVTAAAQAGAESVHLRAAHMRSAVAEQTGPNVTVAVNIFTEQEQPGAPVLNSDWQFEFRDTGQGWRISEIRAIKIADLTTDQIERELPRGH